jgi:nucleotide-binding universal stress UspA family protein
MKNILVLTDFSENAKAAERYALQLALHAKGNLTLYNAYHGGRERISGNVVWPHDVHPSLELQSISNLQVRINELNEEIVDIEDNIYRPEIRHLGNAGSLTDKLNEVISENNIWLVVMGTKGETFANNVLFGSNVFKVLETINCPVLIIPKDAAFKDLKKIAYATDFRSSDQRIIEWLYELTNVLKVGLSIVHISSDAISDEENDAVKKQEKIYQLEFPKIAIELYQGKGVQHSLHEIVGQRNINVLALMHRKYGLFESLFRTGTSHEMIKHTEIPVLIFPGL